MKLYILILSIVTLSFLTADYFVEKYEYAKFLYKKAKEYNCLFNDFNHSFNDFGKISISFKIYFVYVLLGCNNFLYVYKEQYRKKYSNFLNYNNIDAYTIAKQF